MIRHHRPRTLRTCLVCALLSTSAGMSAAPARDPLEQGFAQPPKEARLRAYWWWLNGNVTAEVITRDLEEMAAKGFGGALICDAGGAEQDGNDRVPAGPTFFSPEWRELYKHALREADRVGLELSLNIQSGWNLGGPMIKPQDAPKRLVWSETRISGPGVVKRQLAKPEHPPAFYRDVAVLAYPLADADRDTNARFTIAAGSAQPGLAAENAADGDVATFWVSAGSRPGEGPTRDKPEWLALEFAEPLQADGVRIAGRPGYGPRECRLETSEEGRTWRPVTTLDVPRQGELTTSFAAVKSARFRLMIYGAFDPRHDQAPRNVQIAELQLLAGGQPVMARPHRRLGSWEAKALHRVLGRSAPVTTALLEESPDVPGEEHLRARDVIDLTERLSPEGELAWDAPAGDWEILRFGCTLNRHCHVSTCSDGWNGYALDPFDAEVFRTYWDAVVEPLIADAGPLAGRVLKYLHTDSWEVEVANWTPTLREEFRSRRGYDLWAYLPAIAGRIVDSREVTHRFLHDFRRTIGDLAVDHHYVLFSEFAARHGLLMHPESGGPHAVPVDSLRCLGMNDAPMSEFWARSWRHRVKDEDRFFVKQPASAAHTYGKKLVLAEGFTTIGPHWQETLWDNLKPSFNRAACEGLNMLVWHAFTCSPPEMGLPGQEYFAGTHFNPNSTWWSRSGPFLAYINRCQFMLQQGLFVADAVYYYGDHVPNFAQLRSSDPARVLPGYDYDVATEEVVLTRMSVEDGRIILPDGMSYRVLVLPDQRAISLPVLRKVRELVEAGATVIGPRPERATGLDDMAGSDAQVRHLASELWGDLPRSDATEHRFGLGRVIAGRTARQVLEADGIRPDFEVSGVPGDTLDYIHRRDGDIDIYFVCSTAAERVRADARFRIEGKAPEWWNPMDGSHRPLPVHAEAGGQTTVPLEFEPFGAGFVVFRDAPRVDGRPGKKHNFPAFETVYELTRPWTVHFDPHWGGPAAAEFPELVNWTQRPEDGIRFYSGTATYVTTFDVPAGVLSSGGSGLYLDLGVVCQLAEVRLNGKQLGILWAMPFRVDVAGILQPAGNRLEIDVVNFWPNRIIGDASLPPEQRRTRTNIRKLTADTPLMDSGLLGPVTLQRAEWK